MTDTADTPDTPQHRPALHFTPRAHWMNDPNGLLVHDGIWHLFFQYHPHSRRWGPMHWGHASSRDLLHWTEHPVALAADAKGVVFSGSAVVDHHDQSGLGRDGVAPWVAVYTLHDETAAKAGSTTFQTQGIATSLDGGLTWTPFAGNPVLPNPGLRDFRDPKLWRDKARNDWIMALACGDHVRFYRSLDLKAWRETGRFGQGLGPPGTLWECPDLFPLTHEGRTHWVLLVSVVRDAPNGGSATLYFVGHFDGATFTSTDGAHRWLDHGPDDYAGVTWHGTGDRRVFIGWMSNWLYAQDVPTAPWRSAMTLPRELALRRVGGTLHVTSRLADEVALLGARQVLDHGLPADGVLNLDHLAATATRGLVLRFAARAAEGFALELSNADGERLVVGLDATTADWFIDRRQAGDSGFHADFARRATAPRLVGDEFAEVTLAFDAACVELFGDGGLSVLTALYFPRRPYDRMRLTAPGARGLLRSAAAPA